MGVDRREYFRFSKAVTRTKRWKGLRLQALRRDDFKCVKCGSRHKLEVDHIISVRQDASLSYEIGNLQVLCKKCHSCKTLEELHGPLSPARAEWRELILSMR